LRGWLWIITGLVLVLSAIPQFTLVGEYWQIAAYLAIACLPVFNAWLALSIWRSYLRFRRMRKAHVLPGILQSLSAKYMPGGDSSLDYWLWLGCTFHTPAGELRSIRYAARVEADPNHPRSAKWRGAPEVPPAFWQCPGVGERVPVPVLFVDDGLYEILGPPLHAVG